MVRLLVVAPTCDGEDVGESWVAFQWVRRLAEQHDVTVLTYAKRGRTPLSRQLPHLRVVEWHEPPLLGRAERLNSLLKPGYLPFYVSARRWTRAALGQGRRFDLGHQIAPVAMRYPSPLVGLGLPFIMGPVGGSLETPAGFEADDDTSPWYLRLRRLDGWRLAHDPLLRRTYEDAACVLGIADYARVLLKGLNLRDFRVMSETGIDHVPERASRDAHGGPLRMLFVGRVVRTKGVRDVVRAIGLLPRGTATLDVVGDGFDESACIRLAHDTGVLGIVTFHGRVDRERVDDFYRRADAFVFPSYREPGGNAPLEAMSFGLPLIVADRGGPASAVDDNCGIRISPTTPEEYARRIAEAIVRLSQDRVGRERMGTAARGRVESLYLWDRKIEQVGCLYDELIARRS